MKVIKQQYADEISEIKTKLSYLEDGLITDLHPNVSMYGSLATNVQKLRKDISVLVTKIVNECESSSDQMDELFKDSKQEESN